MAIHHIPTGHSTVSPYLIVQSPAEVIELMTKVFDAQELSRHLTPDGRVMHAEVRIGDTVIMLGGSNEEWQPMPCMVHVYVPDVDAAYRRALQAGATSLQEPTDQFYGDRSAGVRDASGNRWWIATHTEDVSPEEMQRRAQSAAR
jgi:uncharacterized glyoxalase superfamily protein PhnB